MNECFNKPDDLNNYKNLRSPPAYQEYASDILANRNYRAMTLAERGLWDTIRKECWVNGCVPSSTSELAKYLGLDFTEVTNLITPNLMSWFKINKNDLTCPEIDAYRMTIERRRQNMAEGGRTGGKKSQENRRKKDEATLEGRVKPLSGEEKIRAESNRKESLKESENTQEHKAWIDEFESSKQPLSNSYLMQSKGY